MRMLGRVVATGLGLWLAGACLGKEEARRPKIYGIAGLTLASSDLRDAMEFYRALSKLDVPCLSCGDAPADTILLPSGQTIRLVAMPEPAPKDLVLSIRVWVDNVEAMKKYLSAKQVAFREEKEASKEEGPSLTVVDPEGHTLVFVKMAKHVGMPDHTNRIMHTGFVVRDRATMDKFYKDVLGCQVYWQGGMKEGETNWVDMQVPDGTDWFEYMLNIPENADHRLLGVMNHFALGVPSVKAAGAQLEKIGVKLPGEAKIGRDGKWQLNLYDPDETRVELMEYTPVEKPCCSEYTGRTAKP